MADVIISNERWAFWRNIKPIQTSTYFEMEDPSVSMLQSDPNHHYNFGTRFAIETTCTLEYLNWRFFRVVWLVPYLFRILKLY